MTDAPTPPPEGGHQNAQADVKPAKNSTLGAPLPRSVLAIILLALFGTVAGGVGAYAGLRMADQKPAAGRLGLYEPNPKLDSKRMPGNEKPQSGNMAIGTTAPTGTAAEPTAPAPPPANSCTPESNPATAGAGFQLSPEPGHTAPALRTVVVTATDCLDARNQPNARLSAGLDSPSCPRGYVLTGGGTMNGKTLVSIPNAAHWEALFENPYNVPIRVKVFAVCTAIAYP